MFFYGISIWGVAHIKTRATSYAVYMKQHAKHRRIRVKRRLYDMLDLPLNTFGGVFCYNVVGDCEALVKCYDELFAFSEAEVVFDVNGRLFSVLGNDLQLSCLSARSVIITGEIFQAGYVRKEKRQ